MEYPRIGIRPVVDGRYGGIREGAEPRTLEMANAAKALIEELHYPDGTPVQVVMAPSTIGGGAESAACEAFFSSRNVVATLSVTSCWCYGTETMDLNPLTIKAVWGLNATERPGAVYLAAVMAAYAQRNMPAFAIYGRDVQDSTDHSLPEDVEERIQLFAKASVVIGWIRNRSYVNLGSVAMGIMGSYADADMLQKTFGMRTEWVDMTEILRRIVLEIYDPKEFERAKQWRETYCREGTDQNVGKTFSEQIRRSKVVPPEQDWDFVIKMTMVMRDILFGNPALAELGWPEEALGKNAAAGGFQGQRHWTDWLPSGDFSETMLATSFDWNGPRMPIPFATENDTLNAVSMMLGSLLSHTAPCFHDVRTYWSPEALSSLTEEPLDDKARNGFIHLINSGATALDGTGACRNQDGEPCMKPFWEMQEYDMEACLSAAEWLRTNYVSFKGGGFSCHYTTRAEMPVTMIRVNIVEGIGPVLQLAEGHTLCLPENLCAKIDRRTNPFWPSIWFAPRLTGKAAFRDVYSVMANWGCNHAVTVYGHIGSELVTLCAALRIPVNMHNIPDEKIFRPHCWSGFGTAEGEAADYAACRQYGPLYR